MICPRCNSDQADILAKSPVEGQWEVYTCPICFFTWRSTEPAAITNPDLYNKKFKIEPDRIRHMQNMPPLPLNKVK